MSYTVWKRSIKIYKWKAEFVNLKTYSRTECRCLAFSNYIIEQHLYTPREFRRI